MDTQDVVFHLEKAIHPGVFVQMHGSIIVVLLSEVAKQLQLMTV